MQKYKQTDKKIEQRNDPIIKKRGLVKVSTINSTGGNNQTFPFRMLS